MKSMLTIIKKELKRFFTDKRLIATLILPGLLIFVLYSIMGSAFDSFYEVDEDYCYNIAVINEPDELKDILMIFDIEYNMIKVDESHFDGALEAVEQGAFHLLVYYPTDFSTSVTTPHIEIYYNYDIKESYYIYNYYYTALNAYESFQNNLFDVNILDKDYNVASTDSTNFMVLMLPMLLMSFLISGAVSTATESISGEKERGTIANLLITPISRFKLAFAKIISISIPALVSALASFAGLMLSFPKLTGEDTSLSISVADYFALFGVIVITVLFFTVIVSMVSTYAKSIKEAQQTTAPLILITSVLGIVTIFFTSPSLGFFCIPILNSTLLISGIATSTYTSTQLFISFGANIIFIVLGMFAIAKMFNSEKIIFNK